MEIMKNMSVDFARRRFIFTAGTALAAPVAIAVPWTRGSAAVFDEAALKARVALFEDQNAIREAARAFVKHVNGSPGAGADLARLSADPVGLRLPPVRSLAPDPHGADDAIEVAADGRTATAWLHYTAETERPIEPASPLVEMARVQGGGVARQSERGVLEGAFVKLDGVWKIERIGFHPV